MASLTAGSGAAPHSAHIPLSEYPVPEPPKLLSCPLPPVRLPAAIQKSLALLYLPAPSKQLQLFDAALQTWILLAIRMQSLWMP